MKIETFAVQDAKEKFGIACKALSFTLFSLEGESKVIFVTMHEAIDGKALGTIGMTADAIETSIEAFREALKVLNTGKPLGAKTEMKVFIPKDQQN